MLDSLEAGKFSALAFIHKYLFNELYDFAGVVRDVNIAKGGFRFAPVMYLDGALQHVSDMPQSTFEEIIANTKYGLFAKKMGGGSVNPATGEFNFAVNVGYLIEDGKITKPVRGATLVGSGKDVLMRIDMIADNLDVGQGMCGSLSGSVPTNVGQPTIRLSHMTVGGNGGAK